MSAPTKPNEPVTPTPPAGAGAPAASKLTIVLLVLSSANVAATGFVVTRVLKAPKVEVARAEPARKRPAADKGEKSGEKLADKGEKSDGGEGDAGEGAEAAGDAKDNAEGEAAAPVEDKKPGPVVALDGFLVNLNEPGSGRYLKAAVEVEVADSGAVEEMNAQKRSIRDDLLRYLSSLSVADTLGESAKDKIKLAMVTRIGKQIGGAPRVRRLFFTDFMVQ